ncbi:hypothetical protein OH76DRAFT_621450 [Lentinus brumalis]|uniref:BTB domain-containing protein n=1 Tax=Lentinus brumalis TaxID=2498619 RepID=A0A371D921_9APHY|nr:hypothetical protein OH76DRAFT_621450 [Polyporus brumalis]
MDDSKKKRSRAPQDVGQALSQTKRTRHGDVDETAGLRRDAEFWLEDGTIVILAGDVSFRVYKGVLATHSPVFADMFSLPQPETPTTFPSLGQQCPVVRFNDSPKDLRYILRAILPSQSGTLVPKKQQCPSFDAISAHIRLGHKYDIGHLVDHALDYLKDHFTDDFDKWVDRGGDWVPRRFKLHHAIGVVNLARLTGCDTILPIALAVCCTLDPKYLLYGFECRNGSREQLGQDDLLRCLRAKETLMHDSTSALHKALIPIPSHMPACDTPTRCRNGIQELPDFFAYEGPLIATAHPFRNWKVYDYWFEGGSICERCEDHLKERLHGEQRLIWTKLPTILDLPIDRWGLPAVVEHSDSGSDAESDSDSDMD